MQVGRAPADRFDQLGVRQRQHLLLRLQRILVRQIVRRVQQRQRIVDEVELLQAEDRLTVLVEVVALRIGDAVDGIPGLRDDLGIDDRPDLLPEEIGEVHHEAAARVQFPNRDEDRRRVERFGRDAGVIELVERIDHRGRRVGRAEILQSALLVTRALRQHEVSARRRYVGIDQQTRYGAADADVCQGSDVRHRANQIDEIVVWYDLEL